MIFYRFLPKLTFFSAMIGHHEMNIETTMSVTTDTEGDKSKIHNWTSPLKNCQSVRFANGILSLNFNA